MSTTAERSEPSSDSIPARVNVQSLTFINCPWPNNRPVSSDFSPQGPDSSYLQPRQYLCIWRDLKLRLKFGRILSIDFRTKGHYFFRPAQLPRIFLLFGSCEEKVR